MLLPVSHPSCLKKVVLKVLSGKKFLFPHRLVPQRAPIFALFSITSHLQLHILVQDPELHLWNISGLEIPSFSDYELSPIADYLRLSNFESSEMSRRQLPTGGERGLDPPAYGDSLAHFSVRCTYSSSKIGLLKPHEVEQLTYWP